MTSLTQRCHYHGWRRLASREPSRCQKWGTFRKYVILWTLKVKCKDVRRKHCIQVPEVITRHERAVQKCKVRTASSIKKNQVCPGMLFGNVGPNQMNFWMLSKPGRLWEWGLSLPGIKKVNMFLFSRFIFKRNVEKQYWNFQSRPVGGDLRGTFQNQPSSCRIKFFQT